MNSHDHLRIEQHDLDNDTEYDDGEGTEGNMDYDFGEPFLDNDGDGYIDCEDWNCDGTIGDLDPICEGETTGGGESDEICDDGKLT